MNKPKMITPGWDKSEYGKGFDHGFELAYTKWQTYHKQEIYKKEGMLYALNHYIDQHEHSDPCEKFDDKTNNSIKKNATIGLPKWIDCQHKIDMNIDLDVLEKYIYNEEPSQYSYEWRDALKEAIICAINGY